MNRKDLFGEKIYFFVILLIFTGLGLQSKADAALYGISGEVITNTTYGSDNVSRETISPLAVTLSDSATSSGPWDVTSQARYYANLTGSLGTYVYGYCPNAKVWEGGGASAETTVSLYDQLTLSIPAGTYSSDLYVVLSGYVSGTLSAFGSDVGYDRQSNVYEVGQFSLGSGLGGDAFSITTSATETYANPDGSGVSHAYYQSFNLTARVLYAGTYTSDRTATVTVSAYLKGKGTALGLYGNANASESTGMCSDFYHTGEFTSFDVPDGVTWTSASGVFLIPEPATVALLALGAVALRRRKRK